MNAPDLSSALAMVTATDPGRVRGNNEDSVLANPQRGLAVLADGMGGYNAGEVASAMATDLVGREMGQAFTRRSPHARTPGGERQACAALRDAIARTNTAIFQAARSQPGYAGMGTTLVAVQFHDDRLTVAHVGDSRLYRWRGGVIARLTRDHSLLQEKIDSGLIRPEQARFSQSKNIVTRALGVEASVDVETGEHDVLPGDLYLLCSDGLNDMLPDDEIGLALGAFGANLPLCAEQLVQMANDNGGRDNVSVILAHVRKAFPAQCPPVGWRRHVTAWFG